MPEQTNAFSLLVSVFGLDPDPDAEADVELEVDSVEFEDGTLWVYVKFPDDATATLARVQKRIDEYKTAREPDGTVSLAPIRGIAEDLQAVIDNEES